MDSIPEINTVDSGYAKFTSEIDALVMGRSTFETVLGFGIDWPYKKPVFVVSTTLNEIPEKYQGKVHLLKGTLTEILQQIHEEGHYRLYIDGGKLIQSFLREDLIDEMVITEIPVLLGAGVPLFSDVPKPLHFECKRSTLYLDAIVQNHFIRKSNTSGFSAS